MSRKTNSKDAAEHRRRKVIALFADPTAKPTVQDVAKVLGVSPKTVTRDLQAVRFDMKEAQGKLEEYQTQFQKHLPIQKRAQLVAEIAKDKKNRFAQLKAIERADELDGIVSDIERLKARREEEPQQHRPMFIFAQGCDIDFGGGRRNQRELEERHTGEQDESRQQEQVIDITPQPGEPSALDIHNNS
jgi:hypothetical protein